MNATGFPGLQQPAPRGPALQSTPGSVPNLRLPGAPPDNPLFMGSQASAPPVVTIPLSALRRGSIMNMDMMRHSTAPVTVVAEVDATNLKALHDWLKPGFEAQTGIPLTYNPFFIRATVQALKAFPVMNGMLTPAGYVIPRYIHLGVATQIPGGVVLPTIRNAETKSMADIAVQLHSLGQRARSGQLLPHENMDQTFVITNPGRYTGTLFGTPTIKPPNVGILAFEAIQKRPAVAEGDRIVAKPMMYLALTGDHRAVDGVDMIGFINRVKDCLENLRF